MCCSRRCMEVVTEVHFANLGYPPTRQFSDAAGSELFLKALIRQRLSVCVGPVIVQKPVAVPKETHKFSRDDVGNFQIHLGRNYRTNMNSEYRPPQPRRASEGKFSPRRSALGVAWHSPQPNEPTPYIFPFPPRFAWALLRENSHARSPVAGVQKAHFAASDDMRQAPPQVRLVRLPRPFDKGQEEVSGGRSLSRSGFSRAHTDSQLVRHGEWGHRTTNVGSPNR